MFIFYDSYLAFTLNYTTWGLIGYILRKYELKEIKQMSVKYFFVRFMLPNKVFDTRCANFNSRSGVFIIIHRTCLMCNTFFASRISMSFLGNKILTDF